jgi:hypothetical protein
MQPRTRWGLAILVGVNNRLDNGIAIRDLQT